MFSKYEIFLLLQKTNHEFLEKDFDLAEIPRYAYFKYSALTQCSAKSFYLGQSYCQNRFSTLAWLMIKFVHNLRMQYIELELPAISPLVEHSQKLVYLRQSIGQS
jgi:hypothetical protein